MRYLYAENEKIVLENPARICRHPYFSDGAEVASGAAGAEISPLAPGHYLIHEEIAAGREKNRYLGVTGKGGTVMQLTCGAFTADNFDSVVHSARVPMNYYIGLNMINDSTFRGYEQDYGDCLYFHFQPNALGLISPKYEQSNSNWESLTTDEICERLLAVDKWVQEKGIAPLHGFATYTPSNSLIAAMKKIGWNVLHSIIPEQNWSDGHWAINHWGMPNQPFYVADDDFRKPTGKAPAHGNNVVAMTMNSYHLYMPHVVNFGDNVLSPSHFLRWHRTVESGDYPERFRNFLMDYLRAKSENAEPFFLIAGFEFGRSFGVRSMTRHNRIGMQTVIDLAKTMPIVFATGRDVAAYYEARYESFPETVFVQRDYLAGTRIMDKPINSGPSLGMEMRDFKAVFAHQEILPYYHYDYLETWKFAADDVTAPHDFAADDRERVSVRRAENALAVTVASPLPRAVPLALWDAEPQNALPRDVKVYHPARLDDRRSHTAIVLPKGFSGNLTVELRSLSTPPAAEFKGLTHSDWRVQTIGEGEHTQCYLYLDLPLLSPVTVNFRVPAPCRIDSLEKPLGAFAAGDTVPLTFDTRKTWFRFYGLTPEQIQPSAENLAAVASARRETEAFFADAENNLRKIHLADDQWFAQKIPADEKVFLEMDCFGNHIFGERSRAKKFDRVVRRADERLDATEYSDGGISLGNGISFWVHPRGVGFEVSGLDKVTPGADGMVNFYLYNTTPPTEKREYSYNVRAIVEGKDIFTTASPWVVPYDREKPEAFLKITIPANAITAGRVSFVIRATQRGVLDDWFAEGGYIAELQRIIVTARK